MSSYKFSLFIIILCVQSFPVQSCNSKWLNRTILNHLKQDQTDQAARKIGQLSNCNEGVLKNTVETARRRGLAAKFKEAAQEALWQGSGNLDVLRECIAILCEGGNMCPSPSPVPSSNNIRPVLVQADELLFAALVNPSANALTAAYAEVVQGTDVGVASENSVTDITSTTSTAAKDVIQTFQQEGESLDEDFIQRIIADIYLTVHQGLEDAISSIFQKCSQNTQSTALSVMRNIESKNLRDVITSIPIISLQESASSQVQDLSDFLAQVAADAFIYFAKQILNVVDDTCSV